MSLRLTLALLTACIFVCEPAVPATPPTASNVSTPADRVAMIDTGSPLSISGTTSGGDGNVDIRCYFGASSLLVASDVPVIANAFSYTGPAHTVAGETCVFRAVPTGT